MNKKIYLYKCPDVVLFLYATKQHAFRSGYSHTGTSEDVDYILSFYNKEYRENVSYIEKNNVFLLLERGEQYSKILYKDKIGWVYRNIGIKFERVK